MNKKIREQDSVRERLQAQIESVERKKEDLDRKIKEQNTRLEQISGLSSDEAKNILIENMKEEAKTEAMTYVNEVMEEAKMSANKEAKRSSYRRSSASLPKRPSKTRSRCSTSRATK